MLLIYQYGQKCHLKYNVLLTELVRTGLRHQRRLLRPLLEGNSLLIFELVHHLGCNVSVLLASNAMLEVESLQRSQLTGRTTFDW